MGARQRSRCHGHRCPTRGTDSDGLQAAQGRRHTRPAAGGVNGFEKKAIRKRAVEEGVRSPQRLSERELRVLQSHAFNLMGVTPKSMWPAVKAMLHSVYDQPDAAAVQAQFDRLLDYVEEKLPAVFEHLDRAGADLLAFATFPKEIWTQIWSNNPTERSALTA